MARVMGGNLKKDGVYTANECWGKGLYRLQEVEPNNADKNALAKYKISIDETLCRKIRAKHRKGAETLAETIERLLQSLI